MLETKVLLISFKYILASGNALGYDYLAAMYGYVGVGMS
jgi:hypothetical protein